MNRRSFFTKLSYTLITAPLAWIGINYLLPSLSTQRKHNTKIRLGKIDELFKDRNFIVTRVGDVDAIVFRNEGEFVAMSLQCTHAQCTVRYSDDSRKFFCPCHGGEFNADGSVAKAPPQRPLYRLTVRVRNGELFISDRLLLNQSNA